MKQRGYSLLLSLFVMIGVGGAVLLGVATHKQVSAHDETLALSRARDALISYAVNYIDHYSAQSAGIGHMPCPDTDSPDQTHADTWHLDGPNPPCAKVLERGWLPRKVDVVGGRYHFHTRSKQRLLYEVSGRYVNNPLGRAVNPSTVGDISVGEYDDVVAVLKTSNQADAAYTLIRTKDIRKQAMQRVGAWLVGKLEAALSLRCSLADAVSCSLNHYKLPYCDFPAKHLLLHWLYVMNVENDCQRHKSTLNAAFAIWDDVPFSRHWFVRNAWFDFIEVQVDHKCLDHVIKQCRFELMPFGEDDLVIPVLLSFKPQVVR